MTALGIPPKHMVTIRDMSNSAAKGCVHFTGSAKENALLSYKIVYKYIIRQSSDRDIRLAKVNVAIFLNLKTDFECCFIYFYA